MLLKGPEPDPGSREPGDWYCMECGNMNFAFRDTCNMRKCGASKVIFPYWVGRIRSGSFESCLLFKDLRPLSKLHGCLQMTCM